MRAGARLALYGAGVAAAFGAAFGLAGVVVPDSAVAAWEKGASDAHGTASDAAHGEGDATAGHLPGGLSAEQGGLLLSPIEAPGAPGENGVLSFRVLDPDGQPVTDYTTEHDKDLHLMVVRTDGQGFRHVHPALDDTGTWSLPWAWEQAGAYRVYADFTPADAEDPVTLSRTVTVGGDVVPVETAPQRTDEVDGYTATLTGELTAGTPGDLSIEITRDGEPVTTLEPYLGAFGHLVALREGDLAFLHVHPEGQEPDAGQSGGPEIRFAATAPTAGRYLLYLDFQIDGQVRTAEFVLDAPHADADSAEHDDSPSEGH
ncbi:heavy-metal-associated domain-containing protein [Microbacterium resistens]